MSGQPDVSSSSAGWSRTARYKKLTKPLLERRRRARINRCLDELKDLLVDFLEVRRDEALQDTSRLEKADILEMTVRHLQRLHSPRDAAEDAQRFQEGFGRCVVEACSFLRSAPGVDAGVGSLVLRHLTGSCTEEDTDEERIPCSESTKGTLRNAILERRRRAQQQQQRQHPEEVGESQRHHQQPQQQPEEMVWRPW